jgi:hypothetical protein
MEKLKSRRSVGDFLLACVRPGKVSPESADRAVITKSLHYVIQIWLCCGLNLLVIMGYNLG